MTEQLFEINESSDLPIWVQLHDRFIYLMNTGHYKPGDQLPTVRKFAADLYISYNTVSKAYMALEREGYISTRQGRGAFVNEQDTAAENLEIDLIVEDFIRSCLKKGMQFDDIPKQVSKGIRKMKREHEKE